MQGVRFSLRWPILLAVTTLSLPAVAEGLETLVVTGTQDADATEMPGATGLGMEQQQPGLRIDSGELLQGLPGVQADSRSNYAQDTRVTLRGFGARSAFGVRGIDLQLDGVPLSTPDGQGQLSSVPVDEVRQVRVLRGPLAALYGNGSGGVILFETGAPEQNRIGAKLLAGEGDRQRHALYGEWREGNWGARLQGSRFDSSGERPHADAERRNAGARLYHQSDSGLETILRFDMSHDPLLQDPLGLSPERWRDDPQAGNERAFTYDSRKKIRHRQASLTVRNTRSAHRWEAALWRGRREVDQWLPFTGDDITSSGAVIDLTRDFAGLRASYTRDLSLAGAPLEATLGLSLEQMEDRRRGFVNDNGVTGALRRNELGMVDSRDLFAIATWEPAERWSVTGGARHSDLTFEVDDYFIAEDASGNTVNPDDSGGRDDDFTAFALGATYDWSERWQGFASLGRGYETATLTEMAYRNEGTGLNTRLSPARSDQRDIGVRFGDSLAPLVELTLFQIDSEDELVVDRSEGGRTTYRNAAETERWGLEASGSLALAPGWWARYSLSYLDATYSSGEWSGHQLPGIADTNAYAQVRWEPWLDERLGVVLVSRYQAEVPTGDDNAVWAPSSVTWDVSVDSERAYGPWLVSGWLKLENVSDKQYVGAVIVNQNNGRSFEPAPGRQVSAGLNLEYQW